MGGAVLCSQGISQIHCVGHCPEHRIILPQPPEYCDSLNQLGVWLLLIGEQGFKRCSPLIHLPGHSELSQFPHRKVPRFMFRHLVLYLIFWDDYQPYSFHCPEPLG